MYGCHGYVMYGMDQLYMDVIASMDLSCMDQLCMATAEPNNGLAWFANFYQFHHLVGCHGILAIVMIKKPFYATYNKQQCSTYIFPLH